MKTTIQISTGIRNIQLKVPDDLYKRFKTICVEEDTNMRAKLLQLMKECVDSMAFIRMPKKEVEKLYADAARGAIAETHRLGLPTTHVDEGGVYDEYPDGRKEYFPEPGP